MSALVPAVIEHQLDAGRKASNLAFALRILPQDRRRDALVFYRFCRLLDDIADSPEISADERKLALDAWTHALQEPGAAPADIEDVIARHGIDRKLLQEILIGVQMDLTINRYATFEDARKYCWRVASAVGLASIRIFGCRHQQSETYAELLGLALQWTNILRDIGEDAANGRIYLPLEDLQRFDVLEKDLLAGKNSPNFQHLLNFEAKRAASFFAEARQALPTGDRASLLPAEIMRKTYERLLTRMSADSFQIFQRRYRLSRIEKMWLAAQTILAGAFQR